MNIGELGRKIEALENLENENKQVILDIIELKFDTDMEKVMNAFELQNQKLETQNQKFETMNSRITNFKWTISVIGIALAIVGLIIKFA